MSAKIDLRDIPADVRKAMNLRAPKRRKMTMHDVRTYSLRVLAVMADLEQSQRDRILRHALKVNEV